MPMAFDMSQVFGMCHGACANGVTEPEANQDEVGAPGKIYR